MTDFVLDPTQIHAIDTAAAQPLTLITGGAGTGKTTIIKQIADRIPGAVLCAFAGKAAARLRDATGYDACTIHRLLKYNGVRFMADTFGSSVTIIIDEASMISADLLAELIRRKPGRIVLVGDAAQLPPVGKGQPFHDLLTLRPDLTCTLETCYRNSEAVYRAAHAIRNGEIPARHETSAAEKWDCLHTGDAERTHERILEFVQGGHIDFEQDIILCPRNGENDATPCSVKGLNRDIVDIVNPRQGDEKFREGDRVINTKNNAEKNVWNGTTGTIHAVDSAKAIWVRLNIPIIDEEASADAGEDIYTDKVLFDKDMIKHLQLAYALTVHKAQGSQFRRVVFPALARDAFQLLDRSLIYTAVTRTQQQCVIVGQYKALDQGIQTVRRKRTVIQELASIETGELICR